MNKNYIFAFLVVIIAAGAFFFFRGNKSSEETQKIHSEALIKLTEIAKKSPMSGLKQMGAALQRYYKKNQKYPAQLDELFPDYMPSKQFIEELNWHYEPRGDNFFLTKTITRKNKKVVASIDKSMTPQMGASTAIASVTKPARPEEETPDTTEETSPLLALKPIETIQPIDPLTMEEPKPESMIEHPEIVSMVEGEIGHGISSSISRKLLVWKDKNGVLGFGNVIYPKTRNQTIYKDGNWINIKNPETTLAATALPKKQIGSKAIAPNYSKKYLVWKDKKGNIGYGNVQYPAIDSIAYICVNGNWQKVVN
jgi:hypothetical protein